MNYSAYFYIFSNRKLCFILVKVVGSDGNKAFVLCFPRNSLSKLNVLVKYVVNKRPERPYPTSIALF